jgi:hypothetical protein
MTSAQKIPAKIANWQTRRKMIIACCTTYSSIAPPRGVNVGIAIGVIVPVPRGAAAQSRQVTRRFPPPCSVEELEACFVVTDSAGSL